MTLAAEPDPHAPHPRAAALARVPLAIGRSRYHEVKDPCPIRHDGAWHLFGTGITGPHRFEVLHATARQLEGPWRMRAPVSPGALTGSCLGAPGLVAAGGRLHMFLQTDYNRLGGRIEHLVSDASGYRFAHAGTALVALPGTAEAGIYDAHPADVAGRKFLVYSAFSVVGEPDIHLAVSESGTWDGPWQRLGPILRHEEVACHNQRGATGYEWGLEGAQLLELPTGGVLLNGVCFVASHPPACRQRLFFARGDGPLGPYDAAGPTLTPAGGDHLGENGHGTVVVDGDRLALFFQERYLDGARWHYALASVPLRQFLRSAAEGTAA